jgi:tetratricopeptide (TPR) repeat protein
MKRASLLRELLDPTLDVGGRARLGCELARDYEDRGEYEEAREVLTGFWPRIGERPQLEGLDRNTAAEVLLRVGVLTSVIGSSQIPNAQESAKNLISESLSIFESKKNKTRIAEAQSELAVCYWRTAEYNNAADLLKQALAQLTTDSELRARTILRAGVVEQDAGRLNESLRLLTENASLFEKINNQMVRGSYHSNLGDVLVILWESEGPTAYLDRALIAYAAASHYFDQAENKRYRANVENNLGFLYYKVHLCKDAHKHLDRARSIFTNLKDKSAVAQVDETRARVFLQENRSVEAEKVARSSVRVLESTDMQSPLAEALTTHGAALARLSTLRRAIDLYQQTGSLNNASKAALVVFQEMGDRLAVVDRGIQITGKTLDEEIQSLEHDLIRYALEVSKGSVTRAAHALGISHQRLIYMLQTRHKDLST